jgi:threonine dehydrogenase-like Zn-dependent dehydrogenase
MAVSVTALARAGVQAGDVVLIVGPGPIGILLATGALAMGAATVGGRPADRTSGSQDHGALTVLTTPRSSSSRTRPAAARQAWCRRDRTAEAIDLALRRSGAEVGSVWG